MCTSSTDLTLGDHLEALNLTGGEGYDTFVLDSTFKRQRRHLNRLCRRLRHDLTAQQHFREPHQQHDGRMGTIRPRYHADTGYLTCDSDGSGKAEGIHFATLDKDLEINQTNFNVV